MPRMRNVCPGTKRERAASDKPVAFAAQTTKSETIGQLERLALGCSVKEEKPSRFALSAIVRKATSLYLLKGRTMKTSYCFVGFWHWSWYASSCSIADCPAGSSVRKRHSVYQSRHRHAS